MPLRAGKSDKVRNANIRTLMGEVGESPHVQSRAQAIAIGYAKQRAAKGKEDGGPATEPVAAAPPPDMSVAAPIPYLGDPEPAPPPPPPRQAMPRPQRPPTGPPMARQSPRNAADLVRNLKLFWDHYGELRPDQQQRLLRMLNMPPDRPAIMKPEIDWDEFMQHHDLPGATHERPLYHPPYRGATHGGAIEHAMRIARQAGGSADGDSGGDPSDDSSAVVMGSGAEQMPGGKFGGMTVPSGGIGPGDYPLGGSKFEHLKQEEKGEEGSVIQDRDVTPRLKKETAAAQGGAIAHAMRIARQAGGANPIAMPLMGKPGDVAVPAFQGFIHSHVPGRTDKHELDVAPGSYVVPADVVSAFGEGNSLAGGHLIKFQMGVGADLAGGIKMPPAGHGMLPMQPHPKLLHMRPMHVRAAPGIGHNSQARRADGGEIDNGDNGNVPIIAAGGEVVIPPERLIHKFGSLDRGHQIWDAIVKQEREAEVKRLQTAPAPKK